MAQSETQSSSHESCEGAHNENAGSEKENRLNQSFTQYPKIADVFIDKTVLVTGATGFLGKVLVEKLLRSCPGIKEVLILIRPSKKGSVENRMQEYIQHHIFNRLREEAPEVLNKLQALTGDIVLDNAGLCSNQLQKVITEVSFVFHCAANVRFQDEPRIDINSRFARMASFSFILVLQALDAGEILNINLVGVQNVLNLCKECQKLEALVHVSTAYAFCNNPVVAEQLYPESVMPQHIIEVTKWMTNIELKTLCMHYIQGRPSLYPFSKAMAETFLVQSKEKVPVIIVRPSIVTASVEEPYSGWIDNFNGPSGFIHVCGKGVVRTLLVNHEVNADWVPVDIVANTLITAAHYLVIERKFINPPMKLQATDGVPIVNCVCPDQNAITWKDVVNIILPELRKYPSLDVYGKPGGTVTSSPVIYFMCRLTYHYLPALLIDMFRLLTLQKPRTISLYRRMHGVMSHLEYYTTRSFTFHSQNMRSLVEHMDPEDRKVFPIDQSVLDWNKYMGTYVLGVRRYFSREQDDTLPNARKRMMRYYYLWLALKLSSACGVLMFMKYLYKRGALKTTLVTSLSVFAMIATRIQNARLQAEMKLKHPRNF